MVNLTGYGTIKYYKIMDFLANVSKYKHQWWRYLLNFLLWIILSNVAVVVGTVIAVSSGMDGNQIQSYMETRNGVFMLSVFTLMLFMFFISFKSVHRGSIRTLINAGQKFRLNIFVTATLIMLLVFNIVASVELIIAGNYQFIFNIQAELPVVLGLVVLVAAQTLFEELVFRAYIPQGLYLLINNKWICALISSTLFALLHGANRFAEGGITFLIPFFVIGFVLCAIAIFDNGIERAWGVHFANNIVGIFFLSHDKMELTGMPSLFKYNGVMEGSFCDVIIISVIFIVTLCVMYKVCHWSIKTA